MESNPVSPVQIIDLSWSGEVQHESITQTIIGCAMKVHRTLGRGFLESVYQNALLHELRGAGLRAEP